MRRILGKSIAFGLLAATAACFGTTSSKVVTRAGEFQIALCSLGCQGGTCAVNQIATNQDIVITFNDDVDPATVSFTTIQVVEVSNGSTPPGEFLVNGRKVTFRPALIETAAGILFGFQEDAIYQIKVFASPESNVIRSVIGRPNLTPITCSVQTSGIIDLAPGRPKVSFSPNSSQPPVRSDFDIIMVFNDLMQKAQLVDPETGESPSVNVVVVDDTPGSAVEITIPGSFTTDFNQNALLTTLTFSPLAPFPGGKGGLRRLRLDFSSQIADLAGNFLSNPGSNFIPLPDATSTSGTFVESFADSAMLDASASTAGLWNGAPGTLISGYDAVSGLHQGGGSGILGSFAPTEDFEFDTDSQTLLTVTGESVAITGGVFMFERIAIPAGVRVSAFGSNPLRLYCRGECVIEGSLDLSGAPAPANFGKYYPRFGERIAGESTGGIFEFEAEGGEGGTGTCSGGSGGLGGEAWYLVDGPPPPPKPDFYDEDNLNNYTSGTPDTNRFAKNKRWTSVHGVPGQGVGGVGTSANPEQFPAQVAIDRALGAGMGSWAWPATSTAVPDAAFTAFFQIRPHFDSIGGVFENESWHRARGGGGGGYWTNGGQGDFFVPGSTDPLLRLLSPPVIDAPNQIWEYNSLYDLDHHVGGGTPDAAGGAYVFPAGIETLDPDLGLLVGGSGGGGAGSSLHGSWWDDFLGLPSFYTFRTCSGAGGGAGGGALQLHAGGRIAVSGLVSLAGGAGGDSEFMLALPYPDAAAIEVGRPGDAGGGGGSGGAILLETSGGLQIGSDALRLTGGRAGKGSAGNHGGAGGSGLIRFHTATGLEPLATVQAMVAPDDAVELGPVGQPGVPNVAIFESALGGVLGDFGPFNGNASGVRSAWFTPGNEILMLDYTNYALTVRYNDGAEQTISYSVDTNSGTTDLYPVPGTDPIWIAFQTGWGQPGSTEPDPITLSDWVIPGYGTTTDGLVEMRSRLSRMVRVMIVFDHDQIAALIGSGAGRYLQVDDLTLGWEGE